MRQLRFVLICAAVCFAGTTLAARAASAREVYLNGVKLESDMVLKNQAFTACDVKFDDDGNVWITAKGVKIGVAGANDSGDAAPSAPAKDAKLTKRYWLVSPQGKPGVAQYDVDVYVNGAWVKKVKSGDDRVVFEVTKFVKPGTNRVRIVATKNAGDKRTSTSPADVMEIIVGEGNVGGGTVTIDRSLIDYKRTAQETQNFADDFTITAR